MKKYFLLVYCLFNGEFSLNSQTLSGKLIFEGKGIPDAIVQLLTSADSTLVKNEFSDERGVYHFTGIAPGSYFLQVQALGFNREVTPTVVVDKTMVLPDIDLRKQEGTLKEVAVVAKKPYIERNKGIVTLNVESSINAEGSSAFEILEKAPGIRIDNNDHISLNGKPGTVVWIDGKPTPMSGADLANYLRGMASNVIEKIEINSNPSAKYDAAGTAIVNIKLKKDKRIGTNGTLNAAGGQGVYPKANGGLSLNHRNKKINVFGSYNYSYRRAFTSLQLKREFLEEDSLIGSFAQHNLLKFDFGTHILRAGADYIANSRNSFGVLVSGVSNAFNPTGDNVSEVFDHHNEQVSVFKTSSHSFNHWRNLTANFNYKHNFDTLGTELTTDLDYARYGNISAQNFDTRYYDLNQIMYKEPYLLTGDLDGQLNLYSIKNDLVKPLKKYWKLEAGQKSSYVVADNALSFFDKSNGTQRYDSTKSNHFLYRENINALYASIAAAYRQWSFQLGLRGQHTHVSGEQLVYNTGFRRNYAQLFPSVFIGNKLNDKNALEFNYSRRITRPSYEQLNPFKFYLDPTTYKEGNPYLQPSITESFELRHVFKQRIYTTFGFGRSFGNIIETIAPLAGQPKITVQGNQNLAMVDVYALNCAIPVDVTTWWSVTNDVNAYSAFYTGNIANTPLNRRGNLTFNFNSVNSFVFSPVLTGEMTINYRAREVYAFDVIEPIFYLNIGIQSKILGNKGTLRLNVNDLLYSNKIRARVHFTGYNEEFLVQRDTRVLTASFTYRFGKSTVPASRRRQGGAEDIKQRAGNSVG